MSKKIVIFLILSAVVLISGVYLSIQADKTSSINDKIKNNSISSNKEKKRNSSNYLLNKNTSCENTIM